MKLNSGGDRPDHWINKQMASNPDAPDMSNHKGFGSDSKAANMGSKYKPILNNNPGPGNYDSERAYSALR